MAYDEELAHRIRAHLQGKPDLSEKAMFGGLAFLVNGNMAVSASGKGGLLLRVDPAQTDALCTDRHAERAVMGGRAMAGWLRIDPDGLAADQSLGQWVDLGVAYARSLPSK